MCFPAGLKASTFDVQLNKTYLNKFNPFFIFFFFCTEIDLWAQFHFKLTLTFVLFEIHPWLTFSKNLAGLKVCFCYQKENKFSLNTNSPKVKLQTSLCIFFQWSVLKIIQYSVISVKIPALKQADVFSWADIVAPAMDHKC